MEQSEALLTQPTAPASNAPAERSQSKSPLKLENYYPYGYQGREMHAVRAPWAMPGSAEDLIDRVVEIENRPYRILSVWRQIRGPIAAGEPIGVEIAPIGSQI
jgi:hypothetical protein